MQLTDWHVMTADDDRTQRRYVYGALNECEFDKMDMQIAIQDWTVDDMANITSNLLEDANKHSECNNPHVIIALMKMAGVDELRITSFMRAYMKHMFQTYGY